MNRKACLWLILFLALGHGRIVSVAADPPQGAPVKTEAEKTVLVPQPVAALVRPILDERLKLHSGQGGSERELGKLLTGLAQKKGRAADEALVVLLCFHVGESQEDTDAVIGRGRRMLTYLEKYQHHKPKIPDRDYPDSIRKSASNKSLTFEGAIKAIKEGRRGTWDNPEG